ncbi:methyl-coenzyme M reductase family protein [Methanobacterium sp.]|uniref:methyl-coenzyme M reductase family protein n=1 Tax=Methanobacterium sp. TaxID=2164 RepID=UPI0025E35700|nr:methyl-coenzyme M reductase family protein [Methanobacterium sp.]MBI5459812.1 methyl CoM reductase subunit C [Methanobacterium sp.]
MYKILHFSGGVYKFDLLAEHVEDVGGLLFQENRLQIRKGSYFLSEEVQVILMVPFNELSSIRELASEIKGEIEDVEIEEPLKSNLIHSLDIYNILCKADDWVDQNIISEIEEEEYNTTGTGLAEFDDDENEDDNDHVQDKLKECLDLMISLELIEKRGTKGKSEYRILKDNNI